MRCGAGVAHSVVHEPLPGVGLVLPREGGSREGPWTGAAGGFLLAFCFSASSESPWFLVSSICHLRRMGSPFLLREAVMDTGMDRKDKGGQAGRW